MGDISMRGKGRALKMKKGGALPSTKGSSKAGMQSKQGRNFLLPKEPKPKRGRDPERKPKFTPKPMPMPRPMPKDGPNFRPMPMPRPKRKLPKEIEKFLMDMPRVRPALKKDAEKKRSSILRLHVVSSRLIIEIELNLPDFFKLL